MHDTWRVAWICWALSLSCQNPRHCLPLPCMEVDADSSSRWRYEHVGESEHVGLCVQTILGVGATTILNVTGKNALTKFWVLFFGGLFYTLKLHVRSCCMTLQYPFCAHSCRNGRLPVGNGPTLLATAWLPTELKIVIGTDGFVSIFRG